MKTTCSHEVLNNTIRLKIYLNYKLLNYKLLYFVYLASTHVLFLKQSSNSSLYYLEILQEMDRKIISKQNWYIVQEKEIYFPGQTSMKHKNKFCLLYHIELWQIIFLCSICGCLGGSDMHKYCERHTEGRNYVNLSGHCSVTRCAANIVSSICFNSSTSGSNEMLRAETQEGGAENKLAQMTGKFVFTYCIENTSYCFYKFVCIYDIFYTQGGTINI